MKLKGGSINDLVIDNELLIRKLLATRLHWCGDDVNLATPVEDAMESFQREPAELVVLDLMLPRIMVWTSCGRYASAVMCRT